MLALFEKRKKKEGDAKEERVDVNGIEDEEESMEGAGNKEGLLLSMMEGLMVKLRMLVRWDAPCSSCGYIYMQ